MKLILFANKNKPNTVECVLELKNTAEKSGAACICLYDEKQLSSLPSDEWNDAFCVVAVGGDGTVLRAASAASVHGKPVLGVNMGRIGFFSEIGADDFGSALGELKSENFFIESSSMLSCELNGIEMGSCLNDFVIHRQELSSITHLDLEIDGDEIGDVMADGLIVGTPAGSTAYTMSAGGPVVAPKLDCILATPICPHSLTVRPIVASSSSKITVRVKSTCRLSMDGQDLEILKPGDLLVFMQSETAARFVRFKKRNVFKLIREKLK